jgi:hypothetical protein
MDVSALLLEIDRTKRKLASLHDILTTAYEDCLTPVPEGFDTVLGYLARYHPDVLAVMGDYADPQVTVRDGFKLAHMAKRYGCTVLWVEAPPALKAQGIDKVRAYPLSLLAKRWR